MDICQYASPQTTNDSNTPPADNSNTPSPISTNMHSGGTKANFQSLRTPGRRRPQRRCSAHNCNRLLSYGPRVGEAARTSATPAAPKIQENMGQILRQRDRSPLPRRRAASYKAERPAHRRNKLHAPYKIQQHPTRPHLRRGPHSRCLRGASLQARSRSHPHHHWRQHH